jgi:transglutaminase-like putative cysteine protease
MISRLSLLTALLALGAPDLDAQTPTESHARTYRVQQTVTLSAIPADAQTVKWWITIPGDCRDQDLLDLTASLPGEWRVVRDPDHGDRFLYTEVSHPGAPTLTAKVAYTVLRRPVRIEVDSSRVTALTDAQRHLFADELRLDSRHMEVTPAIEAIARQACGSETNPAIEAKLLLTAVADSSTHYSRDPSKPKYSAGDAGSCIANGGGTCTDIHSLFIALARSRGIPARLQMGYRLREANQGKDVDPGYRCWAEYFLPSYGWIPTDLVEADDPKGLGRARWFSGLTERRIWLNEGREFALAGSAHPERRVNTMIIGYAEIDGIPARVLPSGGLGAQFSRTVLYTETPEAAVAPVAAN